jgi:hypothetical protein
VNGLTAIALVLLSAAAPLGPVLRQDGFQMKPPSQFRMARMDLFHGTQVGTVSVSPSASRYLSAALVDGEGEDAASLLISVVEVTLSLGPSSRDELSTAVVRHLRDELDQPFQLERAEVKNGRVEVLGSVRVGSQLRRIVVAAWPGETRHVVAVCSAPSGRWEALAPVLSDSFDSMKVEPISSQRLPQRLVWAFAALLAALLLISIGLWRRRQASAQSP